MKPFSDFTTHDPEHAMRTIMSKMEQMFADPGLMQLTNSSPGHPAAIRYQLLASELQGETPLHYLREESWLHQLGMMVIDVHTWGSLGDDNDFWSFLSSDFERRTMISRLKSSTQYFDVIAELFFLGWLRSEGMQAKLLGGDGLPDLQVDDGIESVFIEVKHLKHSSRIARVKEVIRKANKQLRFVDPNASGLLYLRVTREGVAASIDSRVPFEVIEIVEMTERSLAGGHNRCVDSVIIEYDTFVNYDKQNGESVFLLERKFHVVAHPNPLPNSGPKINFNGKGRAIIVPLRWVEFSSESSKEYVSPIVTKSAVISPLFQNVSERKEHVRVSHVLDAFLNADSKEEYSFGNMLYMLATRFVEDRVPHLMIVIAKYVEGESPQIMFCYRLLDVSAGDVAQWSPRDALVKFLERYGVPLQTPYGTALLWEYYIMPQNLEGDTIFMRMERSASDVGDAHCLVSFNDDAEVPTVEVAWAHAIDRKKYRKDLDRALGGIPSEMK